MFSSMGLPTIRSNAERCHPDITLEAPTAPPLEFQLDPLLAAGAGYTPAAAAPAQLFLSSTPRRQRSHAKGRLLTA
jgi:hypothetical protein